MNAQEQIKLLREAIKDHIRNYYWSSCLSHALAATEQPVRADEFQAGYAKAKQDMRDIDVAMKELVTSVCEGGTYRADFLQSAQDCGARLTGKPDASEAIEIVFSVESWRKFDLFTQPSTSENNWIVRERRDAAGDLLDCFIQAPIENDMAYGLEVLGDDYNGYGDIERKLAHCKLIVSLVNADAEHKQSRQVDAWQPIESAPKDGAAVLLLAGGVGIGKWVVTFASGAPANYWMSLRLDKFMTGPVTHWMPLPSAPIDAAIAASKGKS